MGGRTATRRIVVALLLLASTAACASSSGARSSNTGTNPTIATEPAPTTTTNPYAVPEVIDAAYVNRVLSGLDAAIGDVLRLIMSTRTIPREAYDRMRAIYLDADRLQRAIDGYQGDLREGFTAYKPNPGNKTTIVTELVTGTASCIFARVSRDYSPVAATPVPAIDPQWVAIKPLQPGRYPAEYNPTGWGLTYDGFQSDRSRPANPCAG